MKKCRTNRSTEELATLDDFLREEGKLEEFEAIAIKEVRVPFAPVPPRRLAADATEHK